MTQMHLFTKQKQIHRLWEGADGYQGGRWGWGIGREFEIDMHTVITFKIDKQQRPVA